MDEKGQIHRCAKYRRVYETIQSHQFLDDTGNPQRTHAKETSWNYVTFYKGECGSRDLARNRANLTFVLFFSCVRRWQRSYTNSTICTRCLRSCRPCKRQAFTDWAKPGRISAKKIAPHSIVLRPFSTMTTTGRIFATIWRAWNCHAFRIWDCIWPIWCTSIVRIRTAAASSPSSGAPRWITFFASFRITRVLTTRTYNPSHRPKNTSSRFDTLKSCRISSKTINTSEPTAYHCHGAKCLKRAFFLQF